MNGKIIYCLMSIKYSDSHVVTPAFIHLAQNSDGSTAVIENTNTEVMHSFVIPYTSTMKTPKDANIPINAESRFNLNEELVSPNIDASERIIPTPFRLKSPMMLKRSKLMALYLMVRTCSGKVISELPT